MKAQIKSEVEGTAGKVGDCTHVGGSGLVIHDRVCEWGIYYPSSILQPGARPPFFDGRKHRTPGIPNT